MNEIKAARKRLGMTQQQLADTLGIPKRTIENWEGGVRTPPEWVMKLVLEKMESMKGEKKPMRQKTFNYTPSNFLPELKVGDKVILIKKTYLNDDCESYSFYPGTEGVPGNVNKNELRYHGWRGTTDNVSKEALGLREVLKAQHFETDEGEHYMRVTVGPDLLPEEG
jgi:DNA-binding XRE family transcriptional regulator